ncbi:MAG: sulfite exporter TauE/SafE family protein [bacterium]
MDLLSLFLLTLLVFIVAALYSSVGHGGASGYLAALSLFAFSPLEMSSTALVLNLLVAGLALFAYANAHHFSFKLAWPFILFSIPAAFLGSLLKVSHQIYFLLLALALLIAALRLFIPVKEIGLEFQRRALRLSVALPLGGFIGVLSGIVGVGGGIFLSPLLLLMRWATPKETAAISSFFILANSLAGLLGRAIDNSIEWHLLAPLVLVAFVGGLLGSQLGANRFTGIQIKRLLACVLVLAATKLVILSF